jgi:hypothetical protein
VSLSSELATVAAAAAAHSASGESVVGVIATERADGERVYLCSFERDDRMSWLALDGAGTVVASRARVREAASIAALCELAEESAFAGDLVELRAQLAALRMTEAPAGIEEAESAAMELERTLAHPPRVASAGYLDSVGGAARRLERALGESGRSPFADAMQQAVAIAEQLAGDVEVAYKHELA